MQIMMQEQGGRTKAQTEKQRPSPTLGHGPAMPFLSVRLRGMSPLTANVYTYAYMSLCLCLFYFALGVNPAAYQHCTTVGPQTIQPKCQPKSSGAPTKILDTNIYA